MASNKSIWFHIGHAVERARFVPAPRKRTLAGLAERARDALPVGRAEKEDEGGIPAADELVTAGVALAVDRALGALTRRRRPGVGRLVRAGAAGAAAALLVDLVRPLLRTGGGRSSIGRETAEHMLAGAGQGLIYGSVVEPYVPGPSFFRGAVYGTIEHLAHPAGGLGGLLGPHTPHQKLPVIGNLFEDVDAHERAYLEELVFGVAMALIYESSSESRGIDPDE
jgi:hypothetical protein